MNYKNMNRFVLAGLSLFLALDTGKAAAQQGWPASSMPSAQRQSAAKPGKQPTVAAIPTPGNNAPAQTSSSPSTDPKQAFIAYIPQPGEFRWFDSQFHSFRSADDACRAWLGVMQYGQNPKSHTIAMLPTTYSSYTGIPIADCHYQLASTQGNQTPFIRLAAGCGSSAFVPDPTSGRCTPLSNTGNAAPGSGVQAPAQSASSIQTSTMQQAVLTYLQQFISNNAVGTSENKPSPFVSASAMPKTSNFATQAPAGLGSFKGGDVALTAFGCFRSGVAVLCDFDVTKQASISAKAAQLWSSLGLRDQSGHITQRHDAFFLDAGGSKSPVALLSAKPVRLIMEFDDIDLQLSTVSLVNGDGIIQGVPIDLADPGQPEGSLPLRVASPQPVNQISPATTAVDPAPSGTAAQAQAANKTNVNPVDTLNQAADTANKTMQKAKDAKDTIKNIFKGLGR